MVVQLSRPAFHHKVVQHLTAAVHVELSGSVLIGVLLGEFRFLSILCPSLVSRLAGIGSRMPVGGTDVVWTAEWSLR
ncbi:hypothetical protein [Streptomyces canus]|uniref:hypothetical protein n=1 Tax=Streptomyces canus TaxID=58343 RepID=UPI0038645FBD|nr:hypothetical protein OH837_02700 [Streptomyces canus]WSZ63304.1 hypothetical protein OH824_45565 [Streptomyces canus]